MKQKKLAIVLMIIGFILLSIGSIYFLQKRKERLASYSAMTYSKKDSILYEEEWFENFWALDVDIVEYRNSSKFISVLQSKIKQRPNLTTICMEVPLELVDVSELEACIDAYPEITFYTYLEIKPLSFWHGLENSEILEMEDTYASISEVLAEHANVKHFEFYDLEWIVVNEGNYEESGCLNSEVSEVIFHSFTDQMNLYYENENTFSNGGVVFDNEFEDMLLGKTAVVFGDSIWALNQGSTGVASLVTEFSGLEIENLAISGSTATMLEGAPDSFVKVANEYALRSDQIAPDYIFVEYGLNDYFNQVPTDNMEDVTDCDTYGGGLRTGIEILQEKYPTSEVILLGPTTILTYQNGNQNIAGEGKLRDYEHTMEDVAKEYELKFLKNLNTYDLQVYKMPEYLLADQVHLNETGAIVYIRRILNALSSDTFDLDKKWYDENFYIAHACGGIDGLDYTNTREAFVHNYELGHRIFEIDFNFTSDDVLVAVHDWTNKKLSSLYDVTREENLDETPLSSEEFLALKVEGQYSTMTFQDVIDLMYVYPEAYIVLDTKAFDEETIRKQYNIISVELLKHDDLAERIIPQIYSQEMYYTIMEYYSWDTIIFTMYGVADWQPNQIVTFCDQQNIDVVTTFPGRAEASFIDLLKAQGQKIYMHTFNSMEEVNEMIDMGADGIYTDYLYPDEN